MERSSQCLARSLGAALVVLVLAAAPARAQDSPASGQERRRVRMVADTERDLFPDPHVLTCVRMAAVHNLLVDHLPRSGAPPASLAVFLPPDEPGPIDFWRDGWDTEFRYSRAEDGRWELRAAGHDREFGTADDDVLEGWREPADAGGAWRAAWREGAVEICPRWSDPDG